LIVIQPSNKSRKPRINFDVSDISAQDAWRISSARVISISLKDNSGASAA